MKTGKDYGLKRYLLSAEAFDQKKGIDVVLIPGDFDTVEEAQSTGKLLQIKEPNLYWWQIIDGWERRFITGWGEGRPFADREIGSPV